MTDFWTIERIDILRQRKAEGKTFREIGWEIGCTRLAALGKWNRMCIRAGYQPKPRVRNMDAPAPKAKPRLAASAGVIIPAIYLAPPRTGPAIGILDVTGCKWPTGDDASLPGGFCFCNHDTAEGQPYCEYHTKRSIAPWSRELRNKTLRPFGLRFGKAAA